MKKHLKFICFLSLSLTPSFLFSAISCNNEPAADTIPKIIGPEDREAEVVIYSQKEVASFVGFSFEEIKDPSKIVVTNTFEQGLANFETSIVNINLINKTFDVKIVAHNAVATKTPLSGLLSFYYEDQLIEDSPKEPFFLHVFKNPVITDTIQTTQTILLDKSGAGQCVFGKFKVQNAPIDLFEMLEYNVSFVQAGSKITTSLQRDGNDEFSLCVSVTSGIAGTIQSDISFTYKNRLIPIAWDNQLTIELLPAKSIKAPEQDQYTLQTSELTSQVIIPNFTFTSLTQDELDLNITTTSNVELTGSIVNWNEKNSCFDVQINATYTTFCDFNLIVSIVPKGVENLDPYIEKEFKINTQSFIPREALDITIDHTPGSSTACLNGLSEEWKDRVKELNYNTLSIPSDITEIKDEAFNQYLVEIIPNVTNLFFPASSCLQTIGKNAFYYGKFTNDLIIPYSVRTIKDDAFFNCHFKSLTFANLTQKITIGKNVFMTCGDLRGDLILPNSVRLSSGSLWGTGFDGTLYIPPDLGDTGGDVSSAFEYMESLKAIDLSAYVDIPPWLASGQCYLDGIGNKEQKGIVYYSPYLITSQVEQLKQKMLQNGLPEFFQFLPKR